MQQQPMSAQAELDALQAGIIEMLVSPDSPPIWSVDEIALEAGNWGRVHEALAALHASGLVHRLDTFVLPTRAATRIRELLGAEYRGCC